MAKAYKDRDHSVSKKAKEVRAAIRSQKHGVRTNVGDPKKSGK